VGKAHISNKLPKKKHELKLDEKYESSSFGNDTFSPHSGYYNTFLFLVVLLIND
jgi:hypothetical protein